MSEDSGGGYKWVIGTLISLLAAGGGIVAILSWVNQPATPAGDTNQRLATLTPNTAPTIPSSTTPTPTPTNPASGTATPRTAPTIHSLATASPTPQTLTGVWKYKMTSDVSGNTYEGTLHLTQDGAFVTGELDDPGGPPGRKSGVKGTYDGNILELSRGTGLDTIQEYRLSGGGRQLTGRFENTGRYKDSGTFEIKR